MRPAYRQRLQRSDVGRRVTIRRWLHTDDGPRPSDVVGRLVSWSDDGVLTVRRRSGEHVVVEIGDILAARAIPEHPTLPPE